MSSRRKAWRRREWLRRYLIWPLEAAAFVIVLALLATLPRRAAAEVGGTLAAWGSRFSYQHARALRRNLAVAFPHLSPAASADLQREIWRHFGRVLSTYSHLPPVLRRPDRAGGAVEVEGVEHLSAAAREGRFILAGAHFGHWELAGCYAAMAGTRFSGLYTPESNPWIDRILRHLRQKASAHSTLIARGPNAVRRMMEVLREGGGLFIIVDQRVDDGEWLPFFGHPAQTTTTPARLARRFRCPIVPGRAILLPDGRYRITYYEPLRPDLERDADADVIAITTRLNQMFESWIREAPGQWLCLKRRWPKENRQPAQASAGSGIEAQPPKIPASAD